MQPTYTSEVKNQKVMLENNGIHFFHIVMHFWIGNDASRRTITVATRNPLRKRNVRQGEGATYLRRFCLIHFCWFDWLTFMVYQFIVVIFLVFVRECLFLCVFSLRSTQEVIFRRGSGHPAYVSFRLTLKLQPPGTVLRTVLLLQQ